MRIFFLFLLFSYQAFSQDCDSVPELNQKIVKLADAKMKKKIDRGECWDLAKYVLDETSSKWDGFEEYGQLIDRKNECILPGDIIQFENIKLQWEEGGAKFSEEMKHHTAIVYEVISKDELILIHQNTGQHGKKVGITTFRLYAIKKGKLLIYRPVELV